jgi:hypothetical protein
MTDIWSNWKRFPDPQAGESLQAPIGPGLYEVRNAVSGDLVAFDYSGQVASALSQLLPDDSAPFWRRFLQRDPVVHRSRDLEYRTLATTTKEEARLIAFRLIERRHSVFRRLSTPLSA